MKRRLIILLSVSFALFLAASLFHSIFRFGAVAEAELHDLSGRVDHVETVQAGDALQANIVLKDSDYVISLDVKTCEIVGEKAISALRAGDRVKAQWSERFVLNPTSAEPRYITPSTLTLKGKNVLSLEQSNALFTSLFSDFFQILLPAIMVLLLCVCAVLVVWLIVYTVRERKKAEHK